MSSKGKIEETLSVDYLPVNITNNQRYEILQPNPNNYTHSYFKYPCKFIPEIPRWAMKKYGFEGSVIFDPFAGSGTTLLEAMIRGYDAYGTEIDDIAKLIIKVKTTVFNQEKIIEMESTYKELMETIETYDINPTVPKINNLEHWFPIENTVTLGKIRTLIDNVEDEDIRDFLKLCFVSIIRACSNADAQSPKPYVSSRVKKIPKEPREEFAKIFNKNIELMKQLSGLNINNKVKLLEGDALNVKDDEFKADIIITSPPYINAFDYARTLRLENLWIGNLTEEEITKKKRIYVGTEMINSKEELLDLSILDESMILKKNYENIHSVDTKRALIVKRFFEDMKQNMQEMHSILNNNGVYCIVIGDSNIRKNNVESSKILKDIAINIGYKIDCEYSYLIKNPYLRIPRKGRGGKINEDYVLVLRK